MLAEGAEERPHPSSGASIIHSEFITFHSGKQMTSFSSSSSSSSSMSMSLSSMSSSLNSNTLKTSPSSEPEADEKETPLSILDDRWKCSSCTALNEFCMNRCRGCQLLKGHTLVNAPSLKKWECKRCTFVNAKNNKSCEMCNTSKEFSSSRSLTTSTSTTKTTIDLKQLEVALSLPPDNNTLIKFECCFFSGEDNLIFSGVPFELPNTLPWTSLLVVCQYMFRHTLPALTTDKDGILYALMQESYLTKNDMMKLSSLFPSSKSTIQLCVKAAAYVCDGEYCERFISHQPCRYCGQVSVPRPLPQPIEKIWNEPGCSFSWIQSRRHALEDQGRLLFLKLSK
jgi:hypothetical protein